VAWLYRGAEGYDVSWTKDTGFQISDRKYLLELSDDGRFRWRVRVMERTDQVNKNGQPVFLARSPQSEVWVFEWLRPSDSPGPAPTPPVPEP
jgi:hypothetical protein